MSNYALIILASLLLIGCGETEEKIEDIEKSRTEDAGTVSSDERYEFEITGSRNVYRLEDKIEEVVITGDENYITVVSDAMIDTLIITGDRNVVDTEDGHDTTIVDVEIDGVNNFVKLYDVANLTSTSSSNMVIQTAE